MGIFSGKGQGIFGAKSQAKREGRTRESAVDTTSAPMAAGGWGGSDASSSSSCDTSSSSSSDGGSSSCDVSSF